MPIWLPLAQTKVPELVQLVDRLARSPISQVVVFAAIVTFLRVVAFPTLISTPVHKRDGKYTISKWINEFGDAVAYAAIVVFLLIRPFGIQTFVIPSGSMIDTLHVSDYIVANKFVYRVSEPQRGDIVVFKPPVWARDQEDQDFIKRLIGVPGDVIEIRNQKLYRNNKPVDEPYWTYTDENKNDENRTPVPKSEWSTVRPIPDFKLVNFKGGVMPLQYDEMGANSSFGYTRGNPKYALTDEEGAQAKTLPPAAVPAGYYLFLGDNRNGSADSRFWGLAPRDAIVGKAWFVWIPISRWKTLDHAPAESLVH